MACLPVEWIFSCHGFVFCKPCRILPGTTVAGARVPCGPRDFICAGFPAGGAASERAVSRPGEPERGLFLSTARAHDGQCGPGRIRPRSSKHHEQHNSADTAAVLRAAGSDLHRLPRQAGGNPPATGANAHEAEAARKRGPPVRRRPLPGLRRHHHFAHSGLDGHDQIQPDGGLLVHVGRHHLRVRVQNSQSQPADREINTRSRSRSRRALRARRHANARHAVMNRSILIVICDFLLLSLLTFSTDLSKMAGENEGAQPGAKVDVAPKPSDTGGKDLAAVMKLALNEEQKNREQLQAELAKVRGGAQQQKPHLQQQFAAAQANIQILDQKLQSSSAEALMSKEKLAAMEAEAKKESDLAAALQQQLAQLSKNNQIAQDEKQKLAGQLQMAEVEKRAATEKAAMMQQQVQGERAEKAQLAEGFKALATNSGALTREIRENRALAPNTIFSEFVSNRIQTRFLASRSGIFGMDASKSKTEIG